MPLAHLIALEPNAERPDHDAPVVRRYLDWSATQPEALSSGEDEGRIVMSYPDDRGLSHLMMHLLEFEKLDPESVFEHLGPPPPGPDATPEEVEAFFEANPDFGDVVLSFLPSDKIKAMADNLNAIDAEKVYPDGFDFFDRRGGALSTEPVTLLERVLLGFGRKSKRIIGVEQEIEHRAKINKKNLQGMRDLYCRYAHFFNNAVASTRPILRIWTT